ncbi:Peptidyl-Lys metalloendopeptidase [Colletotrichum sp. SAR 10_66]|nr:Peptidyl-Lys metalloendopeptidase [Colletotrichum sp. SAR 10_75]KAJ4999950.1 Peptidyl-Lys metalloendopeptidase [Colletotrichum sp. SAR 10_66]
MEPTYVENAYIENGLHTVHHSDKIVGGPTEHQHDGQYYGGYTQISAATTLKAEKRICGARKPVFVLWCIIGFMAAMLVMVAGVFGAMIANQDAKIQNLQQTNGGTSIRSRHDLGRDLRLGIATLEAAIERATNKSYAAIDHLEANPNGSDIQTTWYGTFSTERYNRVLTAFKKFAPDLATTFRYDCSCTSSVVFATIGGTYGDVKICSVYFNEELLPPTGRHRNQWEDVLGTTDYGYGVDYCKQFALEDPEKAVKNAE